MHVIFYMYETRRQLEQSCWQLWMKTLQIEYTPVM